jgi:hypothetical protein
MARLPASDLDDYSRLAVPLILARFPGWEPFAKLRPRDDGTGSAVEFYVPCPSSAVEHGLWVSTEGEELSVGFHTHHDHFSGYDKPLDPAVIEAGLAHAANIVTERAGVVSWYRDGGFAGSRNVELPHDGPLPGLFEGLDPSGELAGFFSGCDRATLRSWLGQFDRDEVRA